MTYNLQSISSKVCLITGATSGIGREIALQLSQRGVLLVLNARNASELGLLVSLIGPEKALAIPGDCSDPTVAKEMVEMAISKFSRIDIIIANAGVGFFGSILDSTDDQINEMVKTNFMGTVTLIRASLPTMLQNRQGDIVIISSAAGYRGNANEAVYAGTKHAQVGLAGSLDRELRLSGIRVSLVCPAGTNTNFAIGEGRIMGDPALNSFLKPQDVAFQVVTILSMPPAVRTQSWSTWSMGQES